MSSSGGVKLVGLEGVIRKLTDLPNVANGNADEAFGLLASSMENEAKANRPWTDRTSNARRSITGTYEITANSARAVLAIGVDYGVWLEIANGGKYRIVWPTIQANRTKFNAYMRSLLN